MGVLADGFNRAAVGVERNERGFADHHAFPECEHTGVGGAKIDGEVGGESGKSHDDAVTSMAKDIPGRGERADRENVSGIRMDRWLVAAQDPRIALRRTTPADTPVVGLWAGWWFVVGGSGNVPEAERRFPTPNRFGRAPHGIRPAFRFS